MNAKLPSWFAGAGIGAGIMYLLDPDRGKRRRSVIRDKVVHTVHRGVNAADATSSDIANRMHGYNARMRAVFSRAKPSDEVLANRVRSAIGRLTTHPSAIKVIATEGRVILSGPILGDEVHNLLRKVYAVKGVKAVENLLDSYREPGRIPSLQGEDLRRPTGGRPELLQTNWSPAARLITGIAGTAAGIYGLRRRGAGGIATSAAGFTLLARAATNLEMRRLFGLGAGRRAVDIQKTITINAPLERVFEACADYESYPRFLHHVQEIRRLDEKRWHWRTVAGPLGLPVEWNVVTTAFAPNKKLAWRTEKGSLVQHAGVMRFEPNPDGSTTVDIKLSYNPITGAAGHVIASLFGADAKHRLDEDMMRLKAFIETGIIPHDVLRRRAAPQVRPH